jgi:hypothetical protein
VTPAAVKHPTGHWSRLLGDVMSILAGTTHGLLALTDRDNPAPEPVMCAIRWPQDTNPDSEWDAA